jgi:3-deoxy-D-manno-octulosonate 8-phosphate phosphatase (KDO 8-P phosphatase)
VRAPPAALARRARQVRFLVFDVDGVMTDGTVNIGANGDESKTFSIRDGAAIVWARRAGFDIALLSGRPSAATTRRAAELGIERVVQGPPNKRQGYEDLLRDGGFTDREVAYMGDDWLDLAILERVGLAAAPADAAAEVRQRAHWVSRFPGGRGAVRDLIEMMLKVHRRWNDTIRRPAG